MVMAPTDPGPGRADGGRRYASIKDVASRAGVSYQTVSKVLNGGGSVAPATLERIQRAAHEVGYVPNVLARGLVTHGTRTLGVIAADPSDHVLGRFVVAAQNEADYKYLRPTGTHAYAWIASDLNSSGAVGEAAKATAEKGRLTAEAEVAGMLELLREVERFPVIKS